MIAKAVQKNGQPFAITLGACDLVPAGTISSLKSPKWADDRSSHHRVATLSGDDFGVFLPRLHDCGVIHYGLDYGLWRHQWMSKTYSCYYPFA